MEKLGGYSTLQQAWIEQADNAKDMKAFPPGIYIPCFPFFLQSSVAYHNPTKRCCKCKILPLSSKIRQSCICQLAARCARMMMRGQNEWLAGRRKWIWYQEVEPQDCQIVSQLGINVPQTDNEGPVLYCALIVLLLSSSPNKRDFRDVFVRIFYSNYSTQTFPS